MTKIALEGGPARFFIQVAIGHTGMPPIATAAMPASRFHRDR